MVIGLAIVHQVWELIDKIETSEHGEPFAVQTNFADHGGDWMSRQ